MAALGSPLIRKIKGAKTLSFKVKNGSTLYAGSFVAIDSTGYAIAATGAAGEKLVGRAQPTPDPLNLGQTSIVGNTAATPVPEVTVADEAEVFENVTVTGVTAISDLCRLVYLNGDDNVLTLTRPARGCPIGYVSRWYATTSCDVVRLSAEGLALAALAGQGDMTMVLAFGSLASNQLANATTITVPTPPYAGKIRNITANVITAFNTLTSIAVKVQIGGVDVTGAVVTIDTSAAGTQFVGPASAANTFSESSAITLVSALTGSYGTTGFANVFLTFDRTLGL